MNAETFFPKIASKQVIVIQAEHATGILLDQRFEYYKGYDGQEKYLVFDSLEMANAYIDKLKADLNLEFVVYNYKQEVICKINMGNTKGTSETTEKVLATRWERDGRDD